jgi:molybdate transport system substrate-binding protein
VLAQVASFEQNVRAVFTKVALGEADAGVVYASDLVGAGAGGVACIDIPDAFNSVASYPIASVSDSAHPDLAHAFVVFVRSPEGQEILTRHGFAPARPS